MGDIWFIHAIGFQNALLPTALDSMFRESKSSVTTKGRFSRARAIRGPVAMWSALEMRSKHPRNLFPGEMRTLSNPNSGYNFSHVACATPSLGRARKNSFPTNPDKRRQSSTAITTAIIVLCSTIMEKEGKRQNVHLQHGGWVSR